MPAIGVPFLLRQGTLRLLGPDWQTDPTGSDGLGDAWELSPSGWAASVIGPAIDTSGCDGVWFSAWAKSEVGHPSLNIQVGMTGRDPNGNWSRAGNGALLTPWPMGIVGVDDEPPLEGAGHWYDNLSKRYQDNTVINVPDWDQRAGRVGGLHPRWQRSLPSGTGFGSYGDPAPGLPPNEMAMALFQNLNGTSADYPIDVQWAMWGVVTGFAVRDPSIAPITLETGSLALSGSWVDSPLAALPDNVDYLSLLVRIEGGADTDRASVSFYLDAPGGADGNQYGPTSTYWDNHLYPTPNSEKSRSDSLPPYYSGVPFVPLEAGEGFFTYDVASGPLFAQVAGGGSGRSILSLGPTLGRSTYYNGNHTDLGSMMPIPGSQPHLLASATATVTLHYSLIGMPYQEVH